MTQKHLWQLLLILFVLAWAVFEITPPAGRNLISEFENKARNKDATFSNIVARRSSCSGELRPTGGNLRCHRHQRHHQILFHNAKAKRTRLLRSEPLSATPAERLSSASI
jgi:hypothetical protein